MPYFLLKLSLYGLYERAGELGFAGFGEIPVALGDVSGSEQTQLTGLANRLHKKQ